MTLTNVLIAIPLMAFLTIIQVSVLPRFPIYGAVPSLPFIFAIAWGLLRGINEGVVWAFIAGFFVDLFTIAPFGGASITYMLAIGSVIWVNDHLPKNRLLTPLLLAALASFVQQLFYYLYLSLFGYDSLLNSAIISTIVLQAALSLPVYWLLYLIQGRIWPKPVEI